MIDPSTPATSFSLRRAGGYAVVTILVWVVCAVVTDLVSHAFGLYWIETGVPGVALAVGVGVLWEYARRERARTR